MNSYCWVRGNFIFNEFKRVVLTEVRSEDLIEIDCRGSRSRDTGGSRRRGSAKDKGKGSSGVSEKRVVLNPKPLGSSKILVGREEVKEKETKVREMVVYSRRRGSFFEDRLNQEGSRCKVAGKRSIESSEEEEVSLKERKRRLLEGRIRKSKGELKSLNGGISPNVNQMKEKSKGKGIASRIRPRKTRSRLGKNPIVEKVIIEDSSDEEESGGDYNSSTMVVHDQGGSYRSDDRVSSLDLGELGLVPETQAIQEARARTNVRGEMAVDYAFMRRLGRELGISKLDLNKSKLKEMINKVCQEKEEDGLEEELQDNEEVESDEQRMMEDVKEKASWDDDEDFGSDGYEE